VRDKVRARNWKPRLLPAPKIVLLWLVGIAADNGVADAGAREIREKSDLGEHMVPVVRWITDGLSAARRTPTGATIARRSGASSPSERYVRKSARRTRSARAALRSSTGLVPNKQKRRYAQPAKERRASAPEGPLLITLRCGDAPRFARRALQISATG
jgi:hypothetical protein